MTETMYVIEDPFGSLIQRTFAFSEEAAKVEAVSQYLSSWEKLSAQGYVCRRVTVTAIEQVASVFRDTSADFLFKNRDNE